MNSQLRWQSAAKGMKALVPWLSGFANSAAGSPFGARYYYAVWLRHLNNGATVRPGGTPEPAASVRIARETSDLPIKGAFVVAQPAAQ